MPSWQSNRAELTIVGACEMYKEERDETRKEDECDMEKFDSVDGETGRG